MDFLKELQLRRWARENYVPPGRRSDAWDSIVLDEMRRRDDERTFAPAEDLEPECLIDASGAMLIPLVPMTYAFDPPQLGPAAPHFLTIPIRETVSEVPDWGYYFG